MDVGENVLLAVWHHRLVEISGANLLAADHAGDVEPLGLHLVEAALQLLALGRPGRVVLDRLVVRRRRRENCVSAHATDCMVSVDAGRALRRRGVGRRRALVPGRRAGVARAADSCTGVARTPAEGWIERPNKNASQARLT